MRQHLARHWPLVAVLVVGAVERVLVARRVPAAVFQDSIVYLDLAHDPGGVPFHPARPSGYPLALRALSWAFGRDARWMTYAQHVSGLAVGALVYIVVWRLTSRRWLAAAATALVVFDAFAISLERAVLTESLFTLAVTGAVAAAVVGRHPLTVALGGIAVAGSVLLRSSGMFLVPVWLAYVVVTARSRRIPIWMAVAGVAVPLILYMSLHAAAGRGFTTTEADGWFLYGRIMGIADCRGASIPRSTRALCQRPGEGRMDPTNAVWNANSPARRLFSGGVGPPPGEDYVRGMDGRSNGLLRRWAVAIIARHPGRYARLVAGDTYELFRPGGRGAGPEVALDGGAPVAAQYHAVRPLLGFALLAGFVMTVAALAERRVRAAVERWREIAALTLASLALVVGPTATTDLNVRFLVPAIPAITALGAVVAYEGYRMSRSFSRTA